MLACKKMKTNRGNAIDFTNFSVITHSALFLGWIRPYSVTIFFKFGHVPVTDLIAWAYSFGLLLILLSAFIFLASLWITKLSYYVNKSLFVWLISKTCEHAKIHDSTIKKNTTYYIRGFNWVAIKHFD
jgi:hypothetical protein